MCVVLLLKSANLPKNHDSQEKNKRREMDRGTFVSVTPDARLREEEDDSHVRRKERVRSPEDMSVNVTPAVSRPASTGPLHPIEEENKKEQELVNMKM